MEVDEIIKIRGLFKSTCKGFAINEINYKKLFGKDDIYFKNWLNDDKCIIFLYIAEIDALELFTGLFLFSNAPTEDRVKC